MEKFKCIKTIDSDLYGYRMDFKEGNIYDRIKHDNCKKNKELILISEQKGEFMVARHWLHYKFDKFFKEHFVVVKN